MYKRIKKQMNIYWGIKIVLIMVFLLIIVGCRKKPPEIEPLVSGLSFKSPKGGDCTIGMIIENNNKNFILTVGHCITLGGDGFPDKPNDLYLSIRRDDKIIGYVYEFDDSGGVDAALILVENNIPVIINQDANGNVIEGFINPYEGMKVYKIGIATGLTYGTIIEIDAFYENKEKEDVRAFIIEGDNEIFATFGDSGAAIITVDKPHKIVGILSAGYSSNWGMDIKEVLNIS